MTNKKDLETELRKNQKPKRRKDAARSGETGRRRVRERERVVREC